MLNHITNIQLCDVLIFDEYDTNKRTGNALIQLYQTTIDSLLVNFCSTLCTKAKTFSKKLISV